MEEQGDGQGNSPRVIRGCTGMMLRANHQFDEIRVVGGVAERTGNAAGRKDLRGRQGVCRSMSELARKFRANGDGYFYLAGSEWPEGETSVELTTQWKTIGS